MRLLEGEFHNFGSYSYLKFDFSNLGLALAFGKTGSGKSTIPDMISWTLFGQTAKDGNVDEVRSWQTPELLTIGQLEVELNDGIKILVTRKRGKATQNDLFWIEQNIGGLQVRGKDLNDTQTLLESRLGVNSELFLGASYFHEFSSTGLFFTAKAKDRRTVFEKIANLDLAAQLGSKSTDERSASRKLLNDKVIGFTKLQGRRESLHRSYEDSIRRRNEFDDETRARIREFKVKSASFEKTKDEKIQALQLKFEVWQKDQNLEIDKYTFKLKKLNEEIRPQNWGIKDLEEDLVEAQKSRCPNCGGPDLANKVQELYSMISVVKDMKNAYEKKVVEYRSLKQALRASFDKQNPYVGLLALAQVGENAYIECIEEEKKKPNPFKAQAEKLEEELSGITGQLDILQSEIEVLETKISNLTHLHDLSFELRGALLKQSVQNVQDSTNRYLEKYFDSEIRVGFTLEGSDDLTVSIQKAGYDCSYKQLSRGQRALLRMTFVVSIMKAAANNAGVHFDNIFFDEILDGMDGDLKIKAFSMLEELSTEHESIMVIDHDQGFQNLFTKRFHVTMESDNSKIEELR